MCEHDHNQKRDKMGMSRAMHIVECAVVCVIVHVIFLMTGAEKWLSAVVPSLGG